MTMFCIFVLGILIHGAFPAALDDYVYRNDPYYKFEEIGKESGPGYTMYMINMTSQKWKTEDRLDHPIWWHYLAITIPDKIVYKDAAFMLIDGGSNTDAPPTVSDNFVALTIAFAVSTGCIGADLKMIPNQPIVFKDDPEQKKRKEDAVIAWTWKTFVEKNSSDPEFLLRFPMTKASVRGMDTIASISKQKTGNVINKFFIAGASKRGWTTWTTAAVDKRVVAMAPLVMDLLNMQKSLHHHYRSLGGWTFAFDDYYHLNFTQDLDNPNTTKMATYIDPISYNSRYTSIPKMIVTTGGDEFFIPDDSHYYFGELDGPKLLRKVPNAEHSMAGHEIGLLFSLRAFFLSVITNTTLPGMGWQKEFTPTGGKIYLKTDRTPKTVQAYHAKTTDNKRRDFRLVIGQPGDPSKAFPHIVPWVAENVKDMGNNTYMAEFTNPPNGRWLAFFIQATFDGIDESVHEYTTETMIIPDTFPFPDCSGKTCRGTLV
ncbi:autocrine proliferation repressor protein A-like [Mytilus edulis]|uniref:autocrine proliferation repressor protein A-like n=1 Tax=Mytilus edulis TaxID=6550 RepID=UPI0039EF03FC